MRVDFSGEIFCFLPTVYRIYLSLGVGTATPSTERSANTAESAIGPKWVFFEKQNSFRNRKLSPLAIKGRNSGAASSTLCNIYTR